MDREARLKEVASFVAVVIEVLRKGENRTGPTGEFEHGACMALQLMMAVLTDTDPEAAVFRDQLTNATLALGSLSAEGPKRGPKRF